MSKKIGRAKPLHLLRPYPSASSLLSQNWQKVASIKTSVNCSRWPSTDMGLKPTDRAPLGQVVGSVVPASAVPSASVSLLAMRNLRLHSRPTESDLHVTEPGDSQAYSSLSTEKASPSLLGTPGLSALPAQQGGESRPDKNRARSCRCHWERLHRPELPALPLPRGPLS